MHGMDGVVRIWNVNVDRERCAYSSWLVIVFVSQYIYIYIYIYIYMYNVVYGASERE